MHINIITLNHVIYIYTHTHTPPCVCLMFTAEGLIAPLTGVGSFNCYFCTRPFFYLIIYVGGKYMDMGI